MTSPRHTTNAIDCHVGKRLRLRRENLNLSQSALGRVLGLSFSQIQKYERGANRIGAGALYMLARKLNVEVGFFYEGLDDTGLAFVVGVPSRVAVLAEQLATLSSVRIDALEALVDSMRAGQ